MFCLGTTASVVYYSLRGSSSIVIVGIRSFQTAFLLQWRDVLDVELITLGCTIL